MQQWGAVLSASLAGAVCDLRTRRIPNALTGPFFLAGAVWEACAHGWAGLGDGMVGCLLMAAPFVALFLFTPAGGGAGDAKLMGALGVWLGRSNGLVALMSVLAAGVVVGVAYAVARKRLRGVTLNLMILIYGILGLAGGRHKWSEAEQVLSSTQAMLPVPYGLSILAGVCLAMGIAVWKTGALS